MRTLALSAAVSLLAACSLSIDPDSIAPPDPGAPTGLSATPGNGEVDLAWDGAEGDVTGYEVLQGTTSGTLAPVKRVSGGGGATVTTTVNGLTNGTAYFFAVEAVDSAGTASARSEEVTATPFLPDTTRPTVSMTSPGAGATGVAVDAQIELTFSEPMDPGTVSVTLTPLTGFAPVWDPTGTVLVLDLGVDAQSEAETLETETPYTVGVVAGKDLAGNDVNPLPSAFGFTTVGVPPAVDSTTPSAGAAGVPVQTDVVMIFSEPMDKATVQGAFTLLPAVAGGCTWSWLGGDTIATCALANLAFNQTYTATLSTAAEDAAGTPLAAQVQWTFTTAAAPDTTRPTISSSTPGASATGAARSTNIVVTFSEPVNKTSAQTAFAIMSPAGYSGGVFSWNAAGTEMTYNPPSDFPFGTTVSWGINVSLTDLAGNELAAAYNRSFTVIRQGTATLYSVATLDGYTSSTSTIAQTGTTSVYAGDSSANATYRAFLSFSLAGLPTGTTRITSATLYAYQASVTGTPYGTASTALGDLMADSVDYGTSLTGADHATPTLVWHGRLCFLQKNGTYLCLTDDWDDTYTFSTTSTIGWKSASVSAKVDRDWIARDTRGSRSQFRLRFEDTTDSGGDSDYAGFTSGDAASNRPYLYVVYEYP